MFQEIKLSFTSGGAIIAEDVNGNYWGTGNTVEEALDLLRGAMSGFTDTPMKCNDNRIKIED